MLPSLRKEEQQKTKGGLIKQRERERERERENDMQWGAHTGLEPWLLRYGLSLSTYYVLFKVKAPLLFKIMIPLMGEIKNRQRQNVKNSSEDGEWDESFTKYSYKTL